MSAFSAVEPLVKSWPKTLGMILGDLIEAGGRKSFAALRDDIWLKVEDSHVIDQIGKCAERLRPSGWTVEIAGDAVRLFPLMPAAPVEISTASIEAEKISDEPDALRARIAELEAEVADLAGRVEQKGALIGELRAEIDRLTNQRDAERANRLEAQLDAMDGEDAARIAELEAEVERLKLALAAKLVMVQRASEAMRAPDINGSVGAETRDAPVALAPRHVTIPVSEETYRWLEGVALRNRCSPEHVASRLMIAFRKSTREKEAA